MVIKQKKNIFKKPRNFLSTHTVISLATPGKKKFINFFENFRKVGNYIEPVVGYTLCHRQVQISQQLRVLADALHQRIHDINVN
jgi:hypothetical protein